MAHKKENVLDFIVINNELFFKISEVNTMRPFFMTMVSDSNHWLFVSSNGGISAGRTNAQFALFPYYTDDKITESVEVTGSKSIFQVIKDGQIFLWEPFSIRNEGKYKTTRNIYQNNWGNKVIFEEVNKDLQLSFQYQLSSSDSFGFVKQSTLQNLSTVATQIKVLDGLQNIMPYGVPSDLQNSTSNLVDAYKRAELIQKSGLGIYALSAIIVDKAEPAEALKANTVWSTGIDNATFLLSSLQLKKFRNDEPVILEDDVKGEKGAYFLVGEITLDASSKKQWYIVADVNKSVSDVVALSNKIISNSELIQDVLKDVEAGTQHLQQLAAAADSFQYTADKLNDTRHYSNVMFNIMRGGIFDNNYIIEKWDFEKYIFNANTTLKDSCKNAVGQLNETFTIDELLTIAKQTNNSHFVRLATEYLPLKFSRRHGDPSRPWNQFSINTKSEIDGSKILDYQGNWRDIFQNWEALAHSYPLFIEGMISKFLNASTFDGYNPYRVTKDGFDWETIEPDNPWSYIGYWGDHQIIYLIKFLEFAEQSKSGFIIEKLNGKNYVYANVPYRIKSYSDIVSNPKDTIVFDHQAEKKIHERKEQLGIDGALLAASNGEIHSVSFIEKILATTLSKLSNFIPEAGIWMNTQRPEWNDANNALVGNGVSMVTLCYLRRFLYFLHQTLQKASVETFDISEELIGFFNELSTTFSNNKSLLKTTISNQDRKAIVDALGNAGSNFRNTVYAQSFSGKTAMLAKKQLVDFIENALDFVHHSIAANKRKDGLYNAYNLAYFTSNEVKIDYLSEMLEGQVAILSSGCLSAEESISVLNALKQSALYRQDQNSYILYPNKQLPKFLVKNNIPNHLIEQSKLLTQMIAAGDTSLVQKDVEGVCHFNGNFKNANDLVKAISVLESQYHALAHNEEKLLLDMFETVFNHKEFTGRSGTFFAFEGLGSIYWHMVSKLCLAAQESCLWAIENNASAEIVKELTELYYDVKDGIGVHKSPEVYGAFPITPYSHTPLHKGAQQPGMTGQVKEDILTRIGELGIVKQDGKLIFKPTILSSNEFLQNEQKVTFIDVLANNFTLTLPANSLAFTICQVPIIYKKDSKLQIEVFFNDGSKKLVDGNTLDQEIAAQIFNRTGAITYVEVSFNEHYFN
ncbi:MAG: hypothetical protein NTZ59_06430 [Bacteroidetes bacterium]|nr:hypothetical protein [Bacteroidota bacterium]